MYVLGISCHYHDAAAALIHDGLLIAAAEEERFSGKKHDASFPVHAIEFCLRKAQIRAGDVDYVVFYEKPLLKFDRILRTCLGTFPRGWEVFRESMISWFRDKLWIKGQIIEKFGIPASRILFCEHHQSHAASAFFCSPFSEAAILTIDGVGEWATATVGRASSFWDSPATTASSSNCIQILNEIRFPHSLGLLYSAFTAFLGFEVNEGEYKVMGMAPYGQPRYVDQVHKLVEVASDGSLQLDMDYFSFHVSTKQAYNRKFLALFGEPRRPEEEFFLASTDPQRAGERAEKNQYYADVAASIQRTTEEVVLRMAQHAYRQTGLKKLCLAGGVALNSVANGRLLREGPFDEVFIQPAAGDPGGALGAALYAYHVLLGKPRRFVLEHSYWGDESTSEEIRDAVAAFGVPCQWIDDDDQLTDFVVDALSAGQVVGWHQGRFEWGPRALGHRSILADPRREEMKDIVNRKIKFREPFRPFAPAILENAAAEYFDLPLPEKVLPARYMLLVAPVKQAQRAKIPAVTHVDGTGRLQAVKREWNPTYYRLIEKFGQATGVPILLNTSFNLRGEPIVNTAEEALSTFARSGIDLLVMGNAVITKDGYRA